MPRADHTGVRRVTVVGKLLPCRQHSPSGEPNRAPPGALDPVPDRVRRVLGHRRFVDAAGPPLPPPEPTEIILGIEIDLEPGTQMVAWEAELQVDGEPILTERRGSGGKEFRFPQELSFGVVEPGSPLSLELSAFSPQSLSKAFESREAETLAPPSGKHLMRVRLE